MVVLLGVKGAPGVDGRALAYPLLRRGAALAWGLGELPPMVRGENGKPWFPARPELHFNLSHSGPVALCALSSAGPVGVDVEMVRPRRPTLPARALHPEEAEAWREAGGSWEVFYDLWTRKEAWVKCQGGRVWNPRAVPPPALPWRNYAFPGFRAALCGEGELPGAITWLPPG